MISGRAPARAVRGALLAAGLGGRGVRGRQPLRAGLVRPVLVRPAHAGEHRGLRQARAGLRLRARATTCGCSPGGSAGCRWRPRVAGAVLLARDGRAARPVPGPVARRRSRSTWASRSATSAAGCCPPFRRWRCWRPTRSCSVADRLGRSPARRTRLARCARRGACRAGPGLQRARRPGALARRHAQPRPRLDGAQRPGRGRRWWSSRSCPTPGSPTQGSLRDRSPARAARPDPVGPAVDQVPDRPHACSTPRGARCRAARAGDPGRGLRAHPAARR